MDPNKVDDRKSLVADVGNSRFQLEHVRNSRRKLVKRAAGSQWYPDGSDVPVPINQMAQTESVLIQRLMGGDPQALVVGGDPSLDAIAYEQTLALNKSAKQVSLRRKLRRLVRDAFYGIGICRVGMVEDRKVKIREIAPELDQDGAVGVGRLDVDVISFDNWVHDAQADTLESRLFCGHSYWVLAEDIEQYMPGVSKDDIQADDKKWYDEHGNEKTAAISHGPEGHHSHGGDANSDYREKFWLWDLWLPRENAIVTTSVLGTGEFAYVREWKSRKGGPYLFLYYDELPDQAIPKSIMADLALVHDSMNSTFSKLIEQTRNQKQVLGFKPGHEDDATRIRDASSLSIIQMRDPAAVQEFGFNGPDATLWASLLQTRELASIIGGNTDALGGLGAQADTLGQEQMVTAGASGKIESMELDTADFVKEIFEAMRWYLYHEQVEPIAITKEVPGTDIRIPSEFSSAKAEESPGSFGSFLMKIEPYTDVYRSPRQRLAEFMQIWQTIIMPGLQADTIQKPDMEAFVDLMAQYADLPELKSVIRFATPEEQEAAGGGGEARQAPHTSRTLIRRGAPGVGNKGNAAIALQQAGSAPGPQSGTGA